MRSHQYKHFIAPLSDIPMFYIKYFTMHKVQLHAGAIRHLLYGYAYVPEIIHSLKLVDYAKTAFNACIHKKTKTMKADSNLEL